MNLQAKLNKLEEMKAVCKKASPARERMEALFDENTFVELDGFVANGDEGVGVVTGYGMVEGSVVYAFSQDVTVMGGAVSRLHAEKIAKIYELAVKNGSPVVAIYDSNGAKLSEGPEILAAYNKILSTANNLSGVVPQISVVAGSCTGISAMMAASADIVVMAEDAVLYLSDANGDVSAEAAAKVGAAHIVEKDAKSAVLRARDIVSMLPLNNISIAPIAEGTMNPSAASIDDGKGMNEMAELICDLGSVTELKADYGKAAYTALASIGGNTVGFVAVKGKLGSKSSEKIASFVRFCDCFNLAVVSLVDTEGYCCCNELKAQGVSEAAKLAHAYADATTAKVTVYVGSAIGAAGVAFGSADIRLAWPTAVISALEPHTAVEFFWHDKLKGAEDLDKRRDELAEEYIDTMASPYEAAKASLIEDVVAPADTRDAIITALDMLASKRVSKLPKKHSN